jgi:hypothetical protein
MLILRVENGQPPRQLVKRTKGKGSLRREEAEDCWATSLIILANVCEGEAMSPMDWPINPPWGSPRGGKKGPKSHIGIGLGWLDLLDKHKDHIMVLFPKTQVLSYVVKPIFRKLLPYPIYILDSNLNVHTQAFKNAI